MQKPQRKPRLPVVHSTIESSALSKSAKKVLRWLVGSEHTRITFGVNTIARDLDLSERTVRDVLRQLDDTTPAGVGILKLVNKESFGKVPRAYSLDLSKITKERLSAAADGVSVKTEAQTIKRGKMASITRLWSACGFTVTHGMEYAIPGNCPSGIAGVEALGAISLRQLPPLPRQLPRNSYPTVFDGTGSKYACQDEESFPSALLDEVNAELRAACDEPAFSMAARGVA